MFICIINKIRKLLTKKVSIEPKTRNQLEAMTKKELEVYARSLGVELDRRKKQSSLVTEVLRAQHNNDK